MSHYLLHVALHAVLLSLVALALLALFRNPRRRSVLSLVALLSVGVMPWLTPLRPAMQLPSPVAAADRAAVTPPTRMEWTVVRIPPAAKSAGGGTSAPGSHRSWWALAWVAGSATGGAALLFSLWRLQAWRRGLSRPGDLEWQRLQRVVPRTAKRDSFRICHAGGGPCVAGVLSPVMILPARLVGECSDRALAWTVRHEWCHLAGRDSLATLILECVRAMHWWNPFVHLLVAAWKADREKVCDHFAGESERGDYSEFLLAMSQRRGRCHRLAVPMLRSRHYRQLRGRIHALLHAPAGPLEPFGKREGWALGAVLAAGCLLVSGARVAADDMPAASKIVSTEAASDTDRRFHVKFSHMVLIMGEEPAGNGAILTKAEADAILRRAAQARGSGLTTLPAITLRVGESATAESVHEEPGQPAPVKPLTQARTGRFAGLSFFMTSDDQGEKLGLKLHADYGFMPGAAYSVQTAGLSPDTKEAPLVWEKLVQKSAESSGMLSSGEVLVTAFGEVEPGWFGTCFTTVNAVDARGEAVDSFVEARRSFESAEVSVPVPVRGYVRFEAMVASAGMDAGSAPPWHVVTAPGGAGWDQLRERHKATKLPTIRAIAGKSVEPWKELEGLFVGGRLERDELDGPVTLKIGITLPALGDQPAESFTLEHREGEVVIVDLPDVGGEKKRLFLRAERVLR